MRRGAGGFIAAVLALSGCKWAGTRPADTKDKEPPAAAASRPKGGEVPWLDEALGKLPGGDTGVPKAGSWAHPKDGNFNPTAEGRGMLAGRVLDPHNQPAKNAFVRIEAADARPGEKAAAGVFADANGYFVANGLRPGQPYTLTVNSAADGKPLFASVQTRPPQAALVLALRDDLAPGAPPSAVPPVPPVPPGTTVLPPPAPNSALPPPSDPRPPTPRPTDGSWSPSGSARPGAAGVPPTIGGTPAPPVMPAPGTAPDRTAEGPTVPGRAPAVNLPGPPPFPPLPVPPAVTPPVVAPPAGPTGQLMSRPRNAVGFTLLDPLDRPWDFATHKHGSLVLLDFMTTSCVPCKRAIPVLNELQSKYAGSGLELIGVVCDDVSPRERTDRAARYGREHGLNYVLYTEPGHDAGAVRDRFGVEAYPTVVLLGGDGAVLYKGNPNDRSGQLDAAIRRHLRR